MLTNNEKLIQGPAPAIVTPYDREGNLNLHVTDKLIKPFLDAGYGGPSSR